MAVYGYTRVSSEGQEDKTSLDEQADRIAAFAKARGWTVTAMFRDVASGTTFERPDFQRMVALLAPGDSVIVLALSRFSRSLLDGYARRNGPVRKAHPSERLRRDLVPRGRR